MRWKPISVSASMDYHFKQKKSTHGIELITIYILQKPFCFGAETSSSTWVSAHFKKANEPMNMSAKNASIFIAMIINNKMKKVRITEEQLEDLSRKEAIVIEDYSIKRKIAQMRNDTADLKQGELRQLAHRYIDGAFSSGQKYAESELDIEQRAKILKRLQQMNIKIDKIPD